MEVCGETWKRKKPDKEDERLVAVSPQAEQTTGEGYRKDPWATAEKEDRRNFQEAAAEAVPSQNSGTGRETRRADTDKDQARLGRDRSRRYEGRRARSHKWGSPG